jgi:anthranilate synthase component 1
MYVPEIDEFSEISKTCNLISVYKEILADMETPVSAFLKLDRSLRSKDMHSFLLESVEGGEKWGRYSMIGIEPSIIIKARGNKVTVEEEGNVTEFESDDPTGEIKKIMGRYNPADVEGLPRFFGGAVGYFSYDIIRYFENIPDTCEDDLSMYDVYFIITDTILIFDNVRQMIKIVCNAHVQGGDDPQTVYEQSTKKIDDIITRLSEPYAVTPSKVDSSETVMDSNFEKEEFESIVEKAKEYIKSGDIFQVVLSQRFLVEADVDTFDLYRSLRVINPSPYMFYLKFGDDVIVGSSPEVLVRLEDEKVVVRPIAGTRKRGATEDEDVFLEDELLADPKERAEHIMLVDLGRNDVGRVSDLGSVHVDDFMIIERYSHVMHIVSNVTGTLKEGLDAFDVLSACFPAGTVSGAPKIRAMEIIDELEPTKRGPYAGSVGYFSFSGNMDICITIRTIFIKDGKIYLQAGAGIVADSVPENEYYETINKAKAMLKAVEMTKKGLEASTLLDPL